VHVLKRRQARAHERLGHEAEVRAPGAHEPGAGHAARQRPLENDRRIGDVHRRRSLKRLRLGAVAIGHDEQRRQAVAVAQVERAWCELHAIDRVGVEGRGKPDHSEVLTRHDEAKRVVDLDAVHDGEVLIGTPPADGDAAPELVACGHARQRLQRAEHVVEAPGEPSHVLLPHNEGCGPRRGRAWLVIDDGHRLLEPGCAGGRNLGSRARGSTLHPPCLRRDNPRPRISHDEERPARPVSRDEPVLRQHVVEETTRCARAQACLNDAHLGPHDVAAVDDPQPTRL
jgi:hypothetical protein